MIRVLHFILVVTVAMVGLGFLGAHVHGSACAAERFYFPGECCGEYDCFNEPIAQDLVERRPEGWPLKKEQIIIPHDATRRSPDHLFRICRDEMGKGKIIIPKGRPACLWVPEPGN